MLVPLLVPEVGVSAGELRLSTWLVSLGEEVVAGDRIAELLVPGMTFDLAAPVSGRLVRQEKHPETALSPGERLGWIEPIAEGTAEEEEGEQE